MSNRDWYVGGSSTDGSHVDIKAIERSTAVCNGVPVRAASVIIEEHNAEIRRLAEQLRIATDQLQTFSDQGQERYPGEMGTFAHDALICMSVVD